MMKDLASSLAVESMEKDRASPAGSTLMEVSSGRPEGEAVVSPSCRSSVSVVHRVGEMGLSEMSLSTSRYLRLSFLLFSLIECRHLLSSRSSMMYV